MSRLRKLFDWKLVLDYKTWDEPVWIFLQGPYLYIQPTLGGLMWQVIKEWQHDKHLVG